MTARDGIREVCFKGTPYERGMQRGRRLKKTLTVPALPHIPDDFVDACTRSVERCYPKAVEECEGLIEGGGFDRRRMTAYYFARLESGVGGCTMFAVDESRAAGTGPLVGRNYDWEVADLRWCELHRYSNPNGRNRIGYTHHWAGCADILNDAGLYAAIASLPPVPVRAPGMQWNIALDMISERCSSVEEAARMLCDVRHLRPMSYLLADASGTAAVIECTPQEARLRGPEGGIVIAANASQGGEIVADWRGEEPEVTLPEAAGKAPEDFGSRAEQKSQRRIERTAELLAGAEQVDAGLVRRILRDHQAPICRGNHENPAGAPSGTIWSGICRPAGGQFSIAPSLPCRNRYQQFHIQSAD